MDKLSTIYVEYFNDVYIRVFSEPHIEYEIRDYFTFEVPGAKFTPKYRARIWDGKIYLYSILKKTLYAGLVDNLKQFAQTHNYKIEYTNQPPEYDQFSEEEIVEYARGLQIHSKEIPVHVRDYQLDSIVHGINRGRCIILSPTGSGKSLIIYILCRWHLLRNRKILIVTPTTSLVEQIYTDFIDYSSKNKWNTPSQCQKIYSGFTKEITKNITMSTWQSIHRQPESWFKQFDVIIGDEAHLYKASSLTKIMEKMTDTKYRIGTTGSLDNKKIHTLVLEGIFGSVYKATTTKKLQDQGNLAQLKIKSFLFKYPDDERKIVSKLKYQDEIHYIVTHSKRNNAIRDLAISLQGNTLLLFQYVEKHGLPLYNIIKEKAKNRQVYFVSGDTPVEEREKIRYNLSQESNSILIASYGTSSTGINVPSIENIVFSSPSKSIIRVLQSIGRGLRINKDKRMCTLYDITDDFSWRTKKNYTLQHGAERYKIYAKEDFPVKLVGIDL